MVSEDYVELILKALKTDPDTVGFKVKRLVDNRDNGEAIHSLRYLGFSEIELGNFQSEYHRPPNHLNPIRASISKSVGFDSWRNCGEDREYSLACRPLMRTEEFIDKHLYFYLYVNRLARKDEKVNRDAPH